NSIGPVWDSNEVWLITAGGAMFAAFPNWYATLFSGFYLPLVLMLVALIMRGISFEFRSKEEAPAWRALWDWSFFGGSFVAALLWGVAFANFIKGVPIDETMTYTGGFFNLLNPFALAGGLAFVALFGLHGALFLSLKLSGELESRVKSWLCFFWRAAFLLLGAFIIWGIAANYLAASILGYALALLVLVALVFVRQASLKDKYGLAFIFNGVTIVLLIVSFFVALFPNVMISSTGHHLTIAKAASSLTTLKTMTVVAAIFVPIVLLYVAWTYKLFNHRIKPTDHLEY
ncbi:MAG TPA: cytochrome d ubiquinol oxidase subunit II, partial [Candidatus Marinimicrobia bacterium]|nr:cytochrome d ubiquinol oxidase subunit II [Candidatus Neomarinimicrobiota bacterium]